MPISTSEHIALLCPSCDQEFEADMWVSVDAAERPDLAEALRDGTLDRVRCPHCDALSSADAALLFHDPEQRRVYFAVPPRVAEYAWRERAQELLRALVDTLPEETQFAYLGDVQVEQEVEGVRRAVLRRDRRTRARQASAASGQSSVDLMREQLARQTGVKLQEPEAAGQSDREASTPAEPDVQPALPSPEAPVLESTPDELFDALQELLAADTSEQFRAIVVARPALLGEGADTMLAQLANTAYEEGDRALAEALHTARRSLQRMRQLDVETMPQTESIPAIAQTQVPYNGMSQIASAIDALFQATTTAELMQALDAHPALLTPEADRDLATRVELALEEGNERLARQIEERREALIELRAATPDDSAVLQAIEALLTAEDEAAMERIVADYPLLLSDEAQNALSTLATSAQAQGDTTLAGYVAECQALLTHARRST